MTCDPGFSASLNICRSGLEYLSQPTYRLVAPYLLGLMGILGWGTLVESCLSRRTGGFRWSHAFVEGTVIVSGLMLIASLTGYRNLSMAIAVWGVIALGMCGVAHWAWKRQYYWRSAWNFQFTWAGGFIALVTLLCAARLVIEPAMRSDLTSIWAFHAKALTCECLFGSHYIQEKVWTGTHPEYPLYMPLVHAYFFSIADSFRDDVVKLWQAIAFICTIRVLWEALRRADQSRLITTITLAFFLSIGLSLFYDGKVETNCVLFVALICSGLLVRNYTRLPIYLLGLALCKNEGLTSALVFIVVHLGVTWFNKKKEPIGAWLPELSYILPSVGLIALWLPVLFRLPSNHEQYHQQLFDRAAWISGIRNTPFILSGCLHVVLKWPWIPLIVLFPLALYRFVKTRRAQNGEDGGILTILFLWPSLMLGIFLSIYWVTPWGPQLYRVTFERLLLQICLPMILVIAFGLKDLVDLSPGRLRTAGVWLSTALLVYFGFGLLRGEVSLSRKYFQEWVAGNMGAARYQINPGWQAAMELDRRLPKVSIGALLHDTDYFYINYLLYPRRLYPATPDTIAGTWRPWPGWNTPGDVPLDRYHFRFVVDGTRLVSLGQVQAKDQDQD